MDRDRLFVDTVDWLAGAVEQPTVNNLLLASGRMRLLLLDERPLMHQVNATRNFDIRFRVLNTRGSLLDYADKPEEASDHPMASLLDGLVMAVLPDGIAPSLLGEEMIAEHGLSVLTLRLPAFLQERVMFYKGENVTVKDLIRFSAHVAGGVHAGEPDSEGTRGELLAELAESMLITGVEAPIRCLRGIGVVVVEALLPLRDAIVEERSNT